MYALDFREMRASSALSRTTQNDHACELTALGA
jgi:hypothetical protein